MREIISLRQEVQVLRNGGGNGQVRDIGEAVKPKQPGPFDGTHGTLRDFLTQLKAYHRFYPTKLSDPVERFQGFEEAITKVFGTTDEEREAEQKLRELRQRISASDYAAKFRQVTSKLDWDDEPLMSRFYDGLKEEVRTSSTRKIDLTTSRTTLLWQYESTTDSMRDAKKETRKRKLEPFLWEQL
ncbi:retrotransposon gag protein [Hirsutella rhossiliensis]|uniref:Retrotransposon gag protein n=1 Tax=Hirsutella rhossiliensis TaxID=111463 RepID=A0A9P8N7C6_9HYPO|nr:retrotransposon gag protein [Hirsutella rhossiliensis]KAH0968170.1 retrotransposon gag protein [Hirsutella rhossiliensis]